VRLETSHGTIELELDAKKSPKTVENFLSYVKSGHYDGTIFHRVINDFMIQGGGFDSSMSEKKTGAPIRNEHGNGLKNVRGTIAMARTQNPHSATAQFFINLKDNDFLDKGDGYAVFGKVTAGLDVVDKIATAPTGSKMGHGDVPKMPIVIKKATHVVAAPPPASAPAEPKAPVDGAKSAKPGSVPEPKQP
jgi:peptidyl-prolyl cis-trans isomerase B (cyclophilin B)